MKIIAHTMEYCDDKVFSNLKPDNYNTNDYDEYKHMYEDCFHEMRAALELAPVDCCDTNEELLKKSSQIFILRENNKMIGSIAFYNNEIDDLIISKEYQNQGYGKKLLLFAVAKMQDNNVSPIVLQVADWNQNAIKLYLKNGFKIVKTETVN